MTRLDESTEYGGVQKDRRRLTGEKGGCFKAAGMGVTGRGEAKVQYKVLTIYYRLNNNNAFRSTTMETYSI